MKSARWAKVSHLYYLAGSAPVAEREAILAAACGEDQSLREEVRALLEHDPSRNGPLERVAESAAKGWLPDAIGPYRVLSAVGEGGMGTVYEAQQENPRRKVALKVIKPGLNGAELVRRFKQESQALGRLQHPGIARIYESGVADTEIGPVPYFAMEFIAGLPLTDYAKAHGLGTRERLQLSIQVCEAAQHAHQRGIIHRDLKPANILVDETGQPKILDFGVARITDPEGADLRQTCMGELVGTPAYMSPEQVSDPQDVDARCDVYALGVILYELLAERLPYNVRRGAQAAESARRPEEAAPLGSINKTYRGDLETVAAKALERDRTRRYGSAAELAADLKRYLAHEPVLARPASPWYQLRKFARRHRAIAGAAAAVFAALVIGIAATTSESMRARRAEAAALQAEATARAVNDFVQNDLLAQAGPSSQTGKPDADLKVRTALDRAAAAIGKRFQSQPLVEAAIRRTIGNAYLDLALLPEAREQLERAFQLRERALGPDHPDTLESMADLGNALLHGGQVAGARSLFEGVLAARQRRKENGAQMAETMQELANALSGEGDHPAAEKLLSQALEIDRRSLGENNPATLMVMGDLAVARQDLGDYSGAEELYRKVVQSKRAVLGPDHPGTIGSINNLGVLYRQLGRYAEAEAMLMTALEARRRMEGNRFDTLATMRSLALVYQAEGRFADAEKLMDQVIAEDYKVLGADHVDTMAGMYTLADIYRHEGRLDEAEKLFRQSSEGRRKVLGAENPLTAKALLGVAEVKLQRGQFAQAAPIARQAAEVFEKTNRWESSYARAVWGANLAGSGDYAAAEPVLAAAEAGLAKRLASIPFENRQLLDVVRRWLAETRAGTFRRAW